MAKVRVYEIAKEFGIESKVVMAKLQEMGAFVRSASSTIEAPQVRRLKEAFGAEIPAVIRSAIVERRFDYAEEQLAALWKVDKRTWESLLREIGQLITQRHSPGDGESHRVEWLTGLWSMSDPSFKKKYALSAPHAKLSDSTDSLPPTVQSPPIERSGSSQGGQAKPRSSRPIPRRPEMLGRELEDGFVGILGTLFSLSNRERHYIRKQGGGAQFGHDIEFDATDAETGTVRCHVECKNYTSTVGLPEIAPKLLQQYVYWENKKFDYFIIISPKAATSNELSHLIQDCNDGGKLPFKILLWDADHGVEELFRLSPGLYRKLYQQTAPEISSQGRTEIAHRWAARLQPVARIPDTWRNYLTTPKLHELYAESDFEDVRDQAIALGALTESGGMLPGILADNVREWLTSRTEQTLLLLGEFGDGKSFFTYDLGLRLAAEFLENPADGWACLRIPMRFLQEDPNPSALLQRRLDNIGVPLADWAEVTRGHKTLIILDGFDEMSTKLDPQTLEKNIQTLAHCVDYFPGAKVLISSRTHFFEHISDYEQFLIMLGGPRLLRVAPIPLKQRLAHLEAYAAQAGQEAKLAKLKTLYDPIGLAAKPLFLQMIEYTLPGLPTDRFNEVVLYEQYVRDSLKRKVRDLQPSHRLDENRLIKNLMVILDELAIQLHLSRTDYVNLRDFDTGRREGLPELLWAMSGTSIDGSDANTQDARSRVGVRSLLKPVAGVDPERWPVDFFHRSMREFFVARALVRAVAAESEKAKALLARVPLQPEIVDFARLLIQHPSDVTGTDTPEMFTYKLASLAKSAILPLWAGRNLGGNAITLLFALNHRLPHDDWSGLALDYADLAGADLSGMSFKGSSLRGASLDNVRMVGTDLRDADLTGVQLEQTAPVVALAFDADSNTAYAAYGDRSIRRWTLGAGSRTSCMTLAELDYQPTSLHLSPFSDVIVMGAKEVSVLSPLGADDTWIIVARFTQSDDVDLLSIKGYDVTLRGKGNDQILRYDLIERTLEYTATSAADQPGRLFLLSKDMTLAETATGIALSAGDKQWRFPVPEKTGLDVRQLNEDQALLAVGHEDGVVSFWHLHSLLSQPSLDELWRHPSHAGSVTDVRTSGMFVLSGGIDRTICLFALGDGWSAREPLRLHRTLECAGMKIDAVRGLKEQAMLSSLLSETARRHGAQRTRTTQSAGLQRVPTPAEVFGTRPAPGNQRRSHEIR